MQPAGGEELAWVHGLLDYFEAVLYRGEVVAPDFDSVEEMVQPLIPANVYKALFRGKSPSSIQPPDSLAIFVCAAIMRCIRGSGLGLKHLKL